MKHRPERLVVASDIDGTLGGYHEHFRDFAQEYLGRPLPAVDGWRGDQPFFRYLGMAKSTYRQIKLAYRQGGLKRSMPVYEGARDLTVMLRRAGAEVWITTTRPYLRLDNIDPDTRHWLRRHGIQYDGVLFGERKYRDLTRIVGKDRVLCVLEDLPEMARHASDCGLFTYLLDKPYNRPDCKPGTRSWECPNPKVQLPDACLRVENLEEACAEILGMLRDKECETA